MKELGPTPQKAVYVGGWRKTKGRAVAANATTDSDGLPGQETENMFQPYHVKSFLIQICLPAGRWNTDRHQCVDFLLVLCIVKDCAVHLG